MNGAFKPVFLENSPSMVCDQILFMVKNSDLNFQLHETPFNLSLNLKKSFAQHWNRTSVKKNQFCQQNLAQKAPQHAEHVIQPVPQPGSSPVGLPGQPTELFPTSASKDQEYLDLLRKVESLEAAREQSLKENSESLEIYSELDKAHRKLIKENKELQDKHAKTCSDMKVLKNEQKIVLQENNSLSVALKSGKKDSELASRSFEKQISILKLELVKLNEYKIQHQEERKRQKKAEKKMKQRESKNSKSEDEIVKPAAVEKHFVASVPLHNTFDGLAGTDSSTLTSELDNMEDISKIKSGDEDKTMLEDFDETKNQEIQIKNLLYESSNKEAFEKEEDDKAESLKVTNSKHFPDPSFISRDLNQNEPPDTQAVASQSETKDNLMEMNTEEFSKLLDDCITNFRAKQGSK